VKHKKTFSFILLTLLTLMIIMTPFPLANPGSGPIIWSGERELTFDPVYTEEDPENPGHNITIYYTDFDEYPSITATKDNKIWVAWRTDETGNYEIFYKIYTVSTGQWTSDTQLTFNPNIDLGPAILQTLDNRIWVFWASNRAGNYEIFYTVTSDYGVSWSTETQVTDDPRKDVSPAIVQASDGKIWLVWSRQTAPSNEDLFYKTYDGTSWSVDAQLTTNNNLDQLPSVIQAKDGNIWVFWSQYMPDTHTQICYTKSFDGSTWSSETQLTTDPKDNLDPSAFVEQDGTIRVFWQSKDQTLHSTFDLFYSISLDNGTTWSSPIQFTTDRSHDLQPSATEAPDKTLWVVWTSNRLDSNGNSNVDLYYKVSLLGDINKDGIIDITDLDLIKKAMPTTPANVGNDPPGKAAPPWEWGEWNPECDLNIDGKINILDLVIAALNFGHQA